MIIRPIVMEELPELCYLGSQFATASKFVEFDCATFCQSWNRFLSTGVGVVFVADTGKRIVGAIGALQFNEPNCGTLMANEMFWFVDPEHRGCGMDLLNCLEAWAKAIGVKWLWMNYMIDSMPEKVQAIYQRKGFELAETHWVKEIQQ